MEIKTFKYENVSSEGLLPNDGGQIGVDGNIMHSINHGCDENGKHYITISSHRTEDGVVEGIKVVFDDAEEMLRHLPDTSLLKQKVREEK